MIKALSYNIHVGIAVNSYSHYCRSLWKHCAPTQCKQNALIQIANFINRYDLVCLQEVDLGSLRTHFVNQPELIAHTTSLTNVVVRRNRNMGILAQHGMAILSRLPIHDYQVYELPGKIPGRGVLKASVETADGLLDIYSTHLSLSEKDRFMQLKFLRMLLRESSRYLLMGDFNCSKNELSSLMDKALSNHILPPNEPTYPSWNPRKQLDYAVCSDNIPVASSRVVPFLCSDHLPVEVTLNL